MINLVMMTPALEDFKLVLQMEDISTATAASTSTTVRRDNALLNQSLDDIIKQNRNQRRNEKKNKGGNKKNDRPANRNNRNNQSNNKNNNNKMMDTTPVTSGKSIQKQRKFTERRRDSPKLIVRADSGRPGNLNRRPPPPQKTSSTPGLRQPWEKLPTAPLPAAPLKISIRNELADRPVRRSDMMMDTDSIPSSHGSSYNRPVLSANAPAYEPHDALSSRDEYRIGNRFSTQGMAIDYQLPSGASYDTRPTRRY